MDLFVFDEKRGQMKKHKDFKEDSESESLWSEDSESVVAARDPEVEDSEGSIDKCPPNRLFVGVIDINKCEEDARSLYSKLLEEGDNYRTEFWLEVRPVKAEKNLFHLPSTIEEIQEANKVQNEVSHALEWYNQFMPRTQYFKPHTANAKKFLNNAEFISRQLNLYNASKDCISSFLGIEEKEFSKLLRYYSKPRDISIKNFIDKQTDKAKFDSEIAKELEKFIKTKNRQWI